MGKPSFSMGFQGGERSSGLEKDSASMGGIHRGLPVEIRGVGGGIGIQHIMGHLPGSLICLRGYRDGRAHCLDAFVVFCHRGSLSCLSQRVARQWLYHVLVAIVFSTARGLLPFLISPELLLFSL